MAVFTREVDYYGKDKVEKSCQGIMLFVDSNGSYIGGCRHTAVSDG